MKRSNIAVKVTPLLLATAFMGGNAESDSNQQFESCMEAALGKQPGRIVKVEKKTKQGRLVYEFDIRATNVTDWDIECEAKTGKIIEVEQEVTTTAHPLFASKKKISESRAKEIALQKYPGEITEIEYEIEPDGAASYEFDIILEDGSEIKVEIDATSGEIVEANVEKWQIGFE